MNKSDSLANLAPALVAAQAELKNPPFDSKNPHFKNAYASLQSVRDTVTPILAKHGLAVTQLLGANENGPTCETILLHKSGEFISSTLALPVDRANAQGFGSAYSYARRYALMAIVGVVGEPDDDANAASEKSARPAAAPKSALEDVPKGALKITAIGAAQAELTVEQQQRVANVLENVMVFLNKGEYEDALLVLDMAELDSDEKTALWSKLDSKHRSALTKTRDKLKETA